MMKKGKYYLILCIPRVSLCTVQMASANIRENVPSDAKEFLRKNF